MVNIRGARTIRREDRLRLGLIAASIAGHVVVLAVLAARAVGPEAVYGEVPPLIYLDIEPRVMRPDEAPRPVRAPPRDEDEAAPAPSAAFRPDAARVVRPPNTPDAPAPRLATAPPTGAPAPPADPWRVRSEDMGDAVGRSLRAGVPGCRMVETLSAAERAACDQRFGTASAGAPPLEAREGRRFAREGARILAEYEARRRPLSGGIGIVGPQDGPGSNFGIGVAGVHLDPSLRPDSSTNVHTKRDEER